MSEVYLEQKQIEIDNYIRKKHFRKIFLVFVEVKNKVADQNVFFDFVGTTFVKNPRFFVTKFFKSYNRNIVTLLKTAELFKMERYILQKYCLYPNEKLVISFNGYYLLEYSMEIGRLHLTTDRIIFQGSIGGFRNASSAGFIGQGAMNKIIHKKLLDKSYPTDLPCFGYPHTLFGVNKIALNGNQVNLKILFGKIQIEVFGAAGKKVAKLVYDTIIKANNLDIYQL